MLLSYQFKNFKSFKDNVEFSLCAPHTKVKNRFPNNFTTLDNGGEVLKTAVIVGENAGGKSNFVESLDYFKAFFADTDVVHTYKFMINTNHVKSKCPMLNDSTQVFEIEIFIMNQFFSYFLEIDYNGIARESLQLKNKYRQNYKTVMDVKRTITDFTCNRTGDNADECNAKMCGKKATVTYDITIPNISREMETILRDSIGKENPIGLFITKLSILGYEPAICFTDWIKKRLLPETNIINYDLYMQMKNEEDNLRILNDGRYLDIFRMIDYSIVEIEIDDERPYTKTKVKRKNADGNIFTRELSQDSNGVREFFAWSVQIFKVVYENATVFADEMDRVLNPILSDRVIALINGKKHQGQFIFTTHNVLHLDLKNYMKEQIYFITKDVSSIESEMYSLADFPEIRYETTKIYEFYMKGILGGTAFE